MDSLFDTISDDVSNVVKIILWSLETNLATLQNLLEQLAKSESEFIKDEIVRQSSICCKMISAIRGTPEIFESIKQHVDTMLSHDNAPARYATYLTEDDRGFTGLMYFANNKKQ